MKNYSKIFKIAMWVLVIISVVLLVWGFAVGFASNDGQAVEVLLYWAYAMLALAVIAVIIVGAIISAKNNPKSLLKACIGIVAIAAVCFVVYLISPGNMPVQWNSVNIPSQGQLKLTDTILNLTYITGVAAIAAIVVGEIVMSVRNKK